MVRWHGVVRSLWNSSRYLVYLNNREPERESLKTIDLCDQKTAPLTPKSFIYNRHPFSQAGRRGFDPRLPLHVFNELHVLPRLQKPTFRGNEVAEETEVVDKEQFERLMASVPRWKSQAKSC